MNTGDVFRLRNVPTLQRVAGGVRGYGCAPELAKYGVSLCFWSRIVTIPLLGNSYDF